MPHHGGQTLYCFIQLLTHPSPRQLKYFIKAGRAAKPEFFVKANWQLPVIVEAAIRSTALVDIPPSLVDDLGISGDRFILDKPLVIYGDAEIAITDSANAIVGY